MKPDLLHQIEAAQRRRRLQVIISLIALLIVGVVAAVALSAKIYNLMVFPAMAEAEEAAMRTQAGSGMRIGDRFFLLSNTAEIEFSYPGHISETRLLRSDDSEDIVRIELAPAPKRVLLRTEPSIEVTWLVNEEFTGQADSIAIDVLPNVDNAVEVLDLFGRSLKQQIEVDWRNEESKQVIVDVNEWTISLTSQPEGAQISAGTELLGSTPLGLVPSTNTESLVVSKDGFQSKRLSLSSVQLEKLSKVHVILEPAAKGLPIMLVPPGGELIGGQLSGNGTLFVPDLPLPSKVTYLKQGYVAKSQVLTSGTQQLSFELKLAMGELLVTSPTGGQLEIRGMALREIPTLVALPVGDATVTVSSDGFRSEKIEVSIFQDQTTEISPELETLEAYRSRTATPKEHAPHGIVLTKIIGEPIRLGASRNVRGQRANEIFRDVNFTRHFYMSDTEISEAQFSAYSGKASNSNLPVTGVTWEEAVKFCNYLSDKQGIEPFYIIRSGRVVGWNKKSIGYRLPTEAEWEYVSSKYTKRKQSIFIWGNDYEVPRNGFGNIADKSAEGKAKKFIADRSDGQAERASVGFSKQVADLADLAGNVSEWVHDYYSISVPTEQPLNDYQGPTLGRQHFVKGSNYLSSSWTELRNSYREPIDGSRADVGFRVARYVF